MQNYLLTPLNQFYSEMAFLEGRIYILNWFLNQVQKDLQENKGKGITFSTSSLLTRDLSELNPANNLFTTNYEYALKYDDISSEIDNILSREYCFSLSQLYEMVETFLINMITEFLFHNHNHLTTLKLLNSNLILPKNSIRELVKNKLARGKNNRKLIQAVRQLSKFFCKHENNNWHKINLNTWFDLLSEVRHNIIHNRQIMSPNLLKYLSINQRNKHFEEYFERKRVHTEVVIFLSFSKFVIHKELICDFVYFIFKSLSIDNNLDPTYYKEN